ncbi:recombinase family protein [Nocardia otitidiscaviarum]|uniref:recombinase family protein n=1 Tax=Nocardia otitidiscaviarum TaxID=1823 RepID=UPI001894B737|nr:recombinase family protein [Nocardia otitidiscaviarum]MBF6138269.1 recombinase family protein [Nocardia otitidiscaviarum]
MTRYGYARVSTRDQSTDHQIDALRAAGVADEHMFIEKISGKLASRPKLDELLGLLQRGDEVVVTRLRRIGRSHAHLLELVRGFGRDGVDFIVLEQGIDTSTPGGRLIFHFLAALAEYDRELIVEGTLDGLAAAKARGRVGGRPGVLTQDQLDAAQRMYDEDTHTVDQIAAMFGVGRSTLYRKLAAPFTDCVLVVYRNSKAKVDPDGNRRYGETKASEAVQLEADRKWWPIAETRRRHLKAIVYVVDGIVARVRAVDPDGTWHTDDRGYCDVPVGPPLSELEIARTMPNLDLTLGDPRPHVKGKLREYISLR